MVFELENESECEKNFDSKEDNCDPIIMNKSTQEPECSEDELEDDDDFDLANFNLGTPTKKPFRTWDEVLEECKQIGYSSEYIESIKNDSSMRGLHERSMKLKYPDTV